MTFWRRAASATCRRVTRRSPARCRCQAALQALEVQSAATTRPEFHREIRDIAHSTDTFSCRESCDNATRGRRAWPQLGLRAGLHSKETSRTCNFDYLKNSYIFPADRGAAAVFGCGSEGGRLPAPERLLLRKRRAAAAERVRRRMEQMVRAAVHEPGGRGS